MPVDLADLADRLSEALAGKPVIVAANKADTPSVDLGMAEFARLGFEQIFPVAAIHDRGIPALMQAVLACLPPVTDAPMLITRCGEPS